MNKYPYDVIVCLGGGRDLQGNLTELSIQRLNKSVELFKQKRAPLIITLGSKLHFAISGAELRKTYLLGKGIPAKSIIKVEKGDDTILEAFGTRLFARKKGLKKILLVTSDKHLPRALTIFRRIFGKNYLIDGAGNPCGNLINKNEEKEYEDWFKKYFAKLPKNLPDPDFEKWPQIHREYYKRYKAIFSRYHPDNYHMAYINSFWRK